jgi:hypothetical protein
MLQWHSADAPVARSADARVARSADARPEPATLLQVVGRMTLLFTAEMSYVYGGNELCWRDVCTYVQRGLYRPCSYV